MQTDQTQSDDDLDSIRLESWTPEPLATEIDLEEPAPVVSSKSGKFITINGTRCLNLGSHNYLGLADNKRLEDASIEAVRKYGVGSCGPRAFYGTMDVHLKLEEELADFLGVEEAVLYSFSFSTIASAIPAYAKQTDIIFVDECCNFAIQQGIVASKSRVIRFRHNDTRHLEQLIEEVFDENQRKYGKPMKKRTFLIVEGIYAATGDLCPLKELVDLKKKFKIRLFIDESRSFGVLGDCGRGITQHFNINVNDIDIIMASLENAMCAYGGFCAGSSYVIDHQRLAGAGYCFSASLPPMQTQVALESLSIIREDPELVRCAQGIYKYAHDVFDGFTKLKNISHPMSPIKLLVLREASEKMKNNEHREKLLKKICTNILDREQIAITVARYMEDDISCSLPSIRLVVSGCLTRDDVDRVFRVLERFSSTI